MVSSIKSASESKPTVCVPGTTAGTRRRHMQHLRSDFSIQEPLRESLSSDRSCRSECAPSVKRRSARAVDLLPMMDLVNVGIVFRRVPFINSAARRTMRKK